ncbi:MAG: mechanosensitive ion channel [Chlorobi bacterium]|nr:mechanosensitive ion channel [Chlorobiota bacterium]
MPGYLNIRSARIIIVLELLLVLSIGGFAQQEISSKTFINDGDTTVLRGIRLPEVNSSLEGTIQLLKQTLDDIEPDEDLLHTDSVYQLATERLTAEKKKIFDSDMEPNTRVLEDAIQQWKNYKSKLGEWQDIISKRTTLLNETKLLIEKRAIIWSLTLKDAKNQKPPKEILLSIREILTQLNHLRNQLDTELISIYKKQSQITEISLFIDSTINELKDTRTKLTKNYLNKDGAAIWNIFKSSFLYSANIDSYEQSLSITGKTFYVFYDANRNQVYLHFILLLAFLAFFYVLKKNNSALEPGGHKLQRSIKVLDNNILNAVYLTSFVVIWLYPIRQLIVDDAFQLISLVLSLFLLPKIIHHDYRKVIYYAIGLHLLNQMQLLSPPYAPITRLIIIGELVLSFMILRVMLKKQGPLYSSVPAKWLGLAIGTVKLFYVAILIPLIANIFGYIGLTTFVNNIIINTIFNSIAIFSALLILNATFNILLKSKYLLKSNVIALHREIIEKYILVLLNAFGILLWVQFVLNLMSSYDLLMKWLGGFFMLSWEFGDIKIELGAVLSFLLVILITTLISKFIKIILEEEVFSRISLPRGIPGAISMVVRYFIVAWGIVVSIMALGVDISQFSLMAGALGIGIGFGLQNVVFNFIAGLILAFERPIQVGDTVEVNTVIGRVKSIGVRSSTIRTFEGSEVIVPNGNLISNDVINWTLTDRRKRRDIHVGVEYGSDPHKVMEILKTAANGNINVLQNPEPWVLFDGFGDSSLNFRLRIWTAMDVGLTTKSEVTIAIYDGLNQAGINIPFPQTDLHLRSVEPEVENIILQKKAKNTLDKAKPKTE